ncbi:hypothetical protein DV736_g6539, partial [Chaetothyriales sp. CBS 134916]
MAKKPSAARASPAAAAKPTATAKGPATPKQNTVASTTPVTTPKNNAAASSTPSLSTRSSPQDIAIYVANRYLHDTPSRTLVLDIFLLFLVLVGAVQFAYCVLAGNYPFNAFLAGFSAAAGQFVLTISLRLQTSERPPPGASSSSTAAKKTTTTKTVDGVTGEIIEEGSNRSTHSKISSERAFADFVLGSLILHAFCVNFIN